MVFILIFQCFNGKSQDNSNIYYLCIGSGHYDFNPIYPNGQALQNLAQLPEAINSSNIMSKVITDYCKGKGVTLNSTKNKLISKKEILKGLEKLWQIIEKENKPDPFVIVYYCGHGFVDGLLGSQFLLSGTYPRTRENDKIEERIDQNIYLLEFIFLLMMKQPSLSFMEMDKFFDSSNDPFQALGLLASFFLHIEKTPPRWILLLDCCRNPLTDDGLNMKKLQQNYDSSIADKINNGFTMLANGVKELYNNTFSLVDPIIFSGKNMNATPVVEYPKNDLIKSKDVSAEIHVGPICNKTLCVLDSAYKNNQNTMSLKTWLRLITTPTGKENSRPNTSSDIENSVDYKSLFNFK